MMVFALVCSFRRRVALLHVAKAVRVRIDMIVDVGVVESVWLVFWFDVGLDGVGGIVSV